MVTTFFRSSPKRENTESASRLEPPEDVSTQVTRAVEAIRNGRFGDLPDPGSDQGLTALGNLAREMRQNGTEELKRLVKHAGEINDSTLNAASALTELRDIGKETEDFARTTVEMHDIATTITESASGSAAALHNIAESTRSARKAVGAAVTGLGRIDDALRLSEDRLKTLRQEMEAMSGLLAAVETIAGQTRMLALNAMIEAERAGVSGGGFRVVANEVRSLANQTNQTTLALRDRIGVLDSEVTGITAAMEETLSVVGNGRSILNEAMENSEHATSEIEGVTRNIDEIATAVEQQSKATDSLASSAKRLAQRSERGVDSMSATMKALDVGVLVIKERLDEVAKMDIPGAMLWLARSDHVFWKRRVAGRVAGFSDLKIGDLTDHTQCRFGKWCAAISDPGMRNHPAFQKMAGPHAEVHNHGRRALEYMDAKENRKALAEVHEMEKASGDLMALLDELTKWYLDRSRS